MTIDTSPSSAQATPVSVLICTRNRKDNALSAIRSVQKCGHELFELFVLDQSDTDETRAALAPTTQGDPRIKYVHLDRANKPMALNHGRVLATGDYVFITDDDCEVLPEWIGEALKTFASDPRIGAIYGDVLEGQHDPKEGYVPYCRLSRGTIFSVKEFLLPGGRNFGMGANMAFRADVLNTIGGWDPCIGPGAIFASGDDCDVALRVLVAGHGLAFCPDSRTVHYGLRRWASWGKDQARYGFGMGAIFGKQLRCGVFFRGGMRFLAQSLAGAWAQLRRLRRPSGLGYPLHWVRGMAAGLIHPLDRKTRCFRQAREQRDSAHHNRVADIVLREDQGTKSDVDARG